MAYAVVIVRISWIRVRRNNGLQTNISTAFIEKMHQVCRPGAFFEPDFCTELFFCRKMPFYVIILELPPPIQVQKGGVLLGHYPIIHLICCGKYGGILYLQMVGQITPGSQPRVWSALPKRIKKASEVRTPWLFACYWWTHPIIYLLPIIAYVFSFFKIHLILNYLPPDPPERTQVYPLSGNPKHDKFWPAHRNLLLQPSHWWDYSVGGAVGTPDK